MRTASRFALLGLLTLGLSAAGPAPFEKAPDPAPDFTLTDTNGRTHRLSQYAGRWVVLEWLNYDCPFVGKHYRGRNMQALQERYTGQGVVWLSIVSSAPGEQGHFPPAEMNRRTTQHGGRQTAVLMDPTGTVGRAYGARTTPHMFVVNPRREIVYNGAIDNRPSADPSSLNGATNYVAQALAEAMAGRPVTTARTQPYGCSVKYARNAG
ncbi:MAG TPA: thioredoxin family protein [Rubricoccaceae bacterium]|nr:thioredoxin family protein [Rubricoccaceae bacterium]